MAKVKLPCVSACDAALARASGKGHENQKKQKDLGEKCRPIHSVFKGTEFKNDVDTLLLWTIIGCFLADDDIPSYLINLKIHSFATDAHPASHGPEAAPFAYLVAKEPEDSGAEQWPLSYSC